MPDVLQCAPSGRGIPDLVYSTVAGAPAPPRTNLRRHKSNANQTGQALKFPHELCPLHRLIDCVRSLPPQGLQALLTVTPRLRESHAEREILGVAKLLLDLHVLDIELHDRRGAQMGQFG